jgi:hypothetical protein
MKDFIKIMREHSFKRTMIITILICPIAIVFFTFFQLNIQGGLVSSCSYLDPITIDILAFIAALFLIVEGFARILEHPHATLKKQFTRIIRIVFGCSIMTLHIIQFVHK